VLTSIFYKRKIFEMRYILFICFSLFSLTSNAQNQKSSSSVKLNASKQNTAEKPKLVVGIVIDQMRWDYINQFKAYFTSQQGFLRFVNEGASCNNNLIPYVPTVTACGHAAVYTGSTPALHGITGNQWYDNYQQKNVYCVEDPTVVSVGVEGLGSEARILEVPKPNVLEVRRPKAKIKAVSADPINSPSHYKVGGIEVIDFIQAKLTTEEFRGYLQGNVLKYSSRVGYKGDASEDLAKLVWYANKLQETLAT
jgi:hypothetical protein